jgi:hypothetical protein
MPSDLIQRQIDAVLDEAEAASREDDWQVVQQRANAALSLDPESEDARTLLADWRATRRDALAVLVKRP